MGSVIRQPQIAALDRSFSTMYRTAYGNTDPYWPKIATMIPSSTSSNVYGWMKRLLKMQEWLGTRVKQNLDSHEFEVFNRTFEATVSVQREQIEDDSLGTFSPVLADLGRTGAKWPDQLAKEALQNGTTRLGFDGVSQFNNAHPLAPSGTQDNLFAALGAIDGAAWDTVRSAMSSYLGEDDEPLGVMPNLVVAPPQLEREWKIVLRAETIDSGAGAGVTNVQKGSADLLIVPELADEPTVSYALDVSKAIRGLVWQLRRAPTITQMTQPNQDGVFWQNEFTWGIDGRGEVSYGPWWLISRMEV